jgi:hypothetical protein
MGTTEMTLCDLHSILSVTNTERSDSWIYFHHKSLEDYLCSSHRAGHLYQSQADTHCDILTACIQNMDLWNRKLSNPAGANFPREHCQDDFSLLHSCRLWKHLLIEKKCFPPSVLDFDARIVWRCLAFALQSPPRKDMFNDFFYDFHNSIVGWIDFFWQSNPCSHKFLSLFSAKQTGNAGGAAPRSGV